MRLKRVYRALIRLPIGHKKRVSLLRRCNYEIGEDVFIGEDLIVIDDTEDYENRLFIHDRVAISPRVTLVLYAIPNYSRVKDTIGTKKGKIVIEQDAWIGTGAVILPNVKIGEGAIVGANSLVTKDVAKFTVVGGVPAKFIAKISSVQ
jgi:acetyltransferase-like isoleucine patch superfamily enzyme